MKKAVSVFLAMILILTLSAALGDTLPGGWETVAHQGAPLPDGEAQAAFEKAVESLDGAA